MAVVAGVLAIVFGAVQGLGAVANVRAPADAAESGGASAIPGWARALAVLAAVVVVGGGVLLLVGVDAAAAALIAVGLAGVCAVAIANGYWLHGSPTWSHHAVRIPIALVIVALAVLSIS